MRMVTQFRIVVWIVLSAAGEKLPREGEGGRENLSGFQIVGNIALFSKHRAGQKTFPGGQNKTAVDRY